MSGSRVLAVAIDAADAPLIWRWADAGELPVLRRLMDRGVRARLRSPGGLTPEAAWPTLFTGSTLGAHGVYNWRSIQPFTYRRARQPGSTWRKPFWQILRAALPDSHAIVFDAPYSELSRDDAITEVRGWGERGAIARESWPPALLQEVVARHGRFPVWTEEDYIRSRREERRLLLALEDAVVRRTDILLGLLHERAWDVAFACFYELHDGGHAFYKYLHPGAWGYKPRRADAGSAALLRLYKAVDAAVGRLQEALPPEVDLVITSGKGFRANTNGQAVLPRLLEGLGYQVPAKGSPRSRGIEFARGAVRKVAPRPIRRRIFGQVSPEERDRMLEAIWFESIDWGRTRAFAEAEYGHGWIRLNVAGREPEGTVKPGREYEELCEEIAGELRQVTHASTGVPAVEQVRHRADFAPGPHCDKLPDLLITWSSAEILDAVHHPRLGVVREDMKLMPTAEHTGEAFLVAAGPSFLGGVEHEMAELADLAPTLLHLGAAAVPTDMDGRVLTGLLDPKGPAGRAEKRQPYEWETDPWVVSDLGRAASRPGPRREGARLLGTGPRSRG